MDPTPGSLAAVAVIFVLAGAVKGVIGMGLPTVAIGLLALWLEPMQATALMLLPSLVTNVWQALDGPSLRPLLRRLAPLLLAMMLATPIGTALQLGALAGATKGVLGAALLAYAALGWTAVRLPTPGAHERWLSVPVGVATGVLSGASGVFVIPAVPWLNALGLTRDALVQAMGIVFTAATLALAGSLAHAGALQGPMAMPAVLGLAAALVGMRLGAGLRPRLSGPGFRRAFFGGTAAIGLHLLLDALR